MTIEHQLYASHQADKGSVKTREEHGSGQSHFKVKTFSRKKYRWQWDLEVVKG